MEDSNLDFSCYVIFIYGRNFVVERRLLWNFFINIGNFINGEWCLGGDFNIVLKVEDRVNGVFIGDFEIVDIKEFIDRCGVIEMKVIEKYYIWFNGYVSIKIDRVLCNVNWIYVYGYIVVDFREFRVLDYFLVFVDICEGNKFKRFFRFVNILIY